MLHSHGKGKTIAISVNGNYQFHTRYSDGVERIEEWGILIPKTSSDDVITSKKAGLSISSLSLSQAPIEYQLLSRKWKDPSKNHVYTKKLNHQTNQNQWEYEIGIESESANLIKTTQQQQLLNYSVSSTNPTFHAADSKGYFIWRVGRVPWPIETYILNVDNDERSAILKTTNKKYYKKFQIPAMSRLNERLKQDLFRMEYDDTRCELTIYYEKPKAVLDNEEMENKLSIEALHRKR